MLVCSTVTGGPIEVTLRIQCQGSSGVKRRVVPIDRRAVLPAVACPRQLKNVAEGIGVDAADDASARAPEIPGCIEYHVGIYVIAVQVLVTMMKLGENPVAIGGREHEYQTNGGIATAPVIICAEEIARTVLNQGVRIGAPAPAHVRQVVQHSLRPAISGRS